MRPSTSRTSQQPLTTGRGLPPDGSPAPHAEPATADAPLGRRPDQLLAMKAVAAILGVSKRTLWSWIAAGLLPVVRLGSRVVRVESATLARFIAQARAEGRG
jgi:excisionase family DNA binding protein